MITLTWNGTTFTADKAVRGEDYIVLYDEHLTETRRFSPIRGATWKQFTLDGEWTDPAEIPTGEERLQADVDYLSMENEYLEGESEQARADIDYLLMITEEE